ncbi:hypothetical protein bwei_3258 [Bacillus mycoides]|nr:hypothetical protein bwei_3258 [Bacillus mycoides]
MSNPVHHVSPYTHIFNKPNYSYLYFFGVAIMIIFHKKMIVLNKMKI